MYSNILVCGLNGAGKSTIAKALALETGYHYLDIEDFYFPNRNTDHPYSVVLKKDEVEQLLSLKIKEGPFVLASVSADFNEEMINSFDFVIIVDVNKEERIRRMRARSYQQFGSRMLQGGDMYEAEEKFFSKMAMRDEHLVLDSLVNIKAKIIHIDGCKKIEDDVALLKEMICLEA